MLDDDVDVNQLMTATTSTVSLPTLSGENIQINAENKKTVLYFFAPWCNVCHMSIENLEMLHRDHPEYKIVAIALDYDSKEEIVNFTEQHQLTFPVALGNNDIKKAYKISGYPSYYVLNQMDKVVGRSLGYSTELGMKLRTYLAF